MNNIELKNIDELLDHHNNIDFNIAYAVDVYETETELNTFISVPEVQVDLFELKI